MYCDTDLDQADWKVFCHARTVSPIRGKGNKKYEKKKTMFER